MGHSDQKLEFMIQHQPDHGVVNRMIDLPTEDQSSETRVLSTSPKQKTNNSLGTIGLSNELSQKQLKRQTRRKIFNATGHTT
jgi:hypothetical protein